MNVACVIFGKSIFCYDSGKDNVFQLKRVVAMLSNIIFGKMSFVSQNI